MTGASCQFSGFVKLRLPLVGGRRFPCSGREWDQMGQEEPEIKEADPVALRLWGPTAWCSFFLFLYTTFISFCEPGSSDLKKREKFIFGCAESVLGLCCCARAFSRWGVLGPLSSCGAWACCGAQALGTRASAGVVLGLSSCGSQALKHRLSSQAQA